MHALVIVQQLLGTCCPRIHKARLTVVVAAVGAAVRGRRVTLTELGRALTGPTLVKHNIKRIDRLLGNRHLAAERPQLYQALVRRMVGRLRGPAIIVDWTDLTADRRWQLLRAAIPIGGRCLTLYEEVHPLTHLGKGCVHRAFLAQLKALLPSGASPILITDAGFRGPWFQAVERLGWHWIGRVRNTTSVRAYGARTWVACKNLYRHARTQALPLGAYHLARTNPVGCHLHLVKRPKRHRVKKSVFGHPVRSAHSLKKARAQREPWLIAVSPSLAALKTSHIVNLYAARMQIEEAFRDLKCTRFGLGLELNLSRTRERLATLLLIAAIAFFVLWLIGQQAIARAMQFQYQSNTRRSRPVLSVFYLAFQVVRRAADQYLPSELPQLNPHLAAPPLPHQL